MQVDLTCGRGDLDQSPGGARLPCHEPELISCLPEPGLRRRRRPPVSTSSTWPATCARYRGRPTSAGMSTTQRPSGFRSSDKLVMRTMCERVAVSVGLGEQLCPDGVHSTDASDSPRGQIVAPGVLHERTGEPVSRRRASRYTGRGGRHTGAYLFHIQRRLALVS